MRGSLVRSCSKASGEGNITIGVVVECSTKQGLLGLRGVIPEGHCGLAKKGLSDQKCGPANHSCRRNKTQPRSISGMPSPASMTRAYLCGRSSSLP